MAEGDQRKGNHLSTVCNVLLHKVNTTLIKQRSQPSGARNQAAALEVEGVTVTTGALGELMVDFVEFGWFPRLLPSEVAAGVVPSSDEDEEE